MQLIEAGVADEHVVRDKPTVLDRDPDRELATSVGKALAVLGAFRGDGILLGVTQLADRTRLPKSTVHRMLAVLVEHGYVEREDGRYRLSRMMFELGNLVAECRPRSLRSTAAPFLSGLYELTHATVHLAVLEDNDVLVVDKIFGHASVHVPSQVGCRLPALCTALGKAIVSHSRPAVWSRLLGEPIPQFTARSVVDPRLARESLRVAQRVGVAHDVEGVRLGVRCLAAPLVPLGSDDPVGAISMSFGLTDQVPAEAVAYLKHAAASIGEAMGPAAVFEALGR